MREEVTYTCPKCGHKNTETYADGVELISANYCDCDEYDEEANFV